MNATHCRNRRHRGATLRARRGSRCVVERAAPARRMPKARGGLLAKGRALLLFALASLLAAFATPVHAQSLCAAGQGGWRSAVIAVRVLDVQSVALPARAESVRLGGDVGRVAVRSLNAGGSWEGRALAERLGGLVGERVASGATVPGLQLVLQEEGRAVFVVTGEGGACTQGVEKGGTIWIERSYPTHRVLGIARAF